MWAGVIFENQVKKAVPVNKIVKLNPLSIDKKKQYFVETEGGRTKALVLFVAGIL